MHSEILQVLGKLIKTASAIPSTGKLHISLPHIHHNHKRLVLFIAFPPGAKVIQARFISLAESSAATARLRNRGRNIRKKNTHTHTQVTEKN